MKFVESPLSGAWVIESERVVDERGWFARTFDADEFLGRALDATVLQCNLSYNARRDTLRGMHFQAEPYGEAKLVRCLRGAIFDVAIDLRRDSPTHARWHGVTLEEDRDVAFFIPAGMAHGFQTLRDDTLVLYQMGSRYVPEAARGVRWDDPVFGIAWPEPVDCRTMSARDASLPDYRP